MQKKKRGKRIVSYFRNNATFFATDDLRRPNRVCVQMSRCIWRQDKTLALARLSAAKCSESRASA